MRNASIRGILPGSPLSQPLLSHPQGAVLLISLATAGLNLLGRGVSVLQYFLQTNLMTMSQSVGVVNRAGDKSRANTFQVQGEDIPFCKKSSFSKSLF